MATYNHKIYHLKSLSKRQKSLWKHEFLNESYVLRLTGESYCFFDMYLATDMHEHDIPHNNNILTQQRRNEKSLKRKLWRQRYVLVSSNTIVFLSLQLFHKYSPQMYFKTKALTVVLSYFNFR